MPRAKNSAPWWKRPWVIPAAVTTLALGAFGAAIAAASNGSGGNAKRPARISPEIFALAKKWANARGLPLTWVLATIVAESDGNPNAQGDCNDSAGNPLAQCRSVGLMQVNWSVHASKLQQLGIAQTRADLFDPAVNIEAGTLFLRDALDQVRAALMKHDSEVPLDLLVRFAYTGPALAVAAIKNGQHPKDVYKDSAALMAAWSRALAQSTALV